MIEKEPRRTCADCPVKDDCPPQKQQTSLIDEGELTHAQRSHRLSLLKQSMRRLNCPPSEMVRLVRPLDRLIHPTRNPNFNNGIAPSVTPDAGYVADRIASNRKTLSQTKGLKGRRTNR